MPLDTQTHDTCDEPGTSNKETRGVGRLDIVLDLTFLVVAVGLLFLGSRFRFDDQLGDLSISFVAIVLEAVPFVLIGTLIGGMVEVFVPQSLVKRVLEDRGTSSIFVAAGLGFIFPVCECAIVPVCKRLMGKGVPLPTAVAFLLAVPIVNPIVAASTAIAYRFDWTFVGTRLMCGYLIAVGVAFLVQYLWGRDSNVLVHSEETVGHACCQGHDHDHHGDEGFWTKLVMASHHGCDDFFQVAKYLIIGAFVAASARTVIGVEMFARFSESPYAAILLMMLLAIALNLCSEADAFVAAAFRGVMPPAAQMGFMVLGPMLDLKLILMYRTLFKTRVIAAIGSAVFVAVFVLMILLGHGLGGVLLGW